MGLMVGGMFECGADGGGCAMSQRATTTGSEDGEDGEAVDIANGPNNFVF